MNMLRNFTIRFVMLTIPGIFCLMWAGVGLYSTWSLSRVSDGNEVDRQLVKQMTILSEGNDQYFRFVTRLSRAMEVKAAGGTPDLASAQQALDNMGKKLAEMKAISPGPMDEQVSSRVIGTGRRCSSRALRHKCSRRSWARWMVIASRLITSRHS